MPGSVLMPSVTVVINDVTDGVRTVAMNRDLLGVSSDHYSFDLGGSLTIPIISAIGSQPGFSYHKKRGASFISLSSTTETCVCSTGIVGETFGLGTPLVGEERRVSHPLKRKSLRLATLLVWEELHWVSHPACR